MDDNTSMDRTSYALPGGPPRNVDLLETVTLELSEEDHQDLDQLVTNNAMVALLPKDIQNPQHVAFLLTVIISSAPERKCRLNQLYSSLPEAEKLIQGKDGLLEELKVAWVCKRFARIRSLRILQAQQASLHRTEADVRRAIETFLTEIQPIMAEVLEEKASLPMWEPKNMDFEVVEHIRALRIPDLGDSGPSLLLHGLGELPAHAGTSRHLSPVFTSRHHTFLCNASGSSKTRLLLEGLTLNWGLYFVCRPDFSQLGSSDLWWVIHEALDRSPGWTARPASKDTSAYEDAVFTNAAIAKPYLLRVLAARLLIMHLFLQTAVKREGVLSPRHRQLWVLLQAAPVHYLKRDPDVFHNFCTSTLSGASVWQLSALASSAFNDIYQLLRDNSTYSGRLFCVLDEAQVASNAHTTAFMSSNGVSQRPVLKEIVKVWGCLPSLRFVVAGTIPCIQIVEDHVGSAFGGKEASFSYVNDIGAFNNRESQEAYVRRYLPADYLSTVGGWELLQRLWNWLHGRYHFTATYIKLLLENGLLSPHRLLDAYVEQYTKYRPSDGSQTLREEEPALPPDCINKLQSFSVVFDFEELNKHAHLVDCARHIVFRYLTRRQITWVFQPEVVQTGFARFPDINSAQTGFARFLNNSARVDERLSLLSMARWLDTQPGSTFDAYLTKHMEEAEIQWKAFEDALTLYVCRIFQCGIPLTDVFEFFEPTPDWAKQSAQLTTFTKGQFGEYIWAHVNLSLPQAVIPGRSLGLDAMTWEQVEEWSSDQCCIPICLPRNLMGPDLVFALQLEDNRFLWVAVQVKHHPLTPDLNPWDAFTLATPDYFKPLKPNHCAKVDKAIHALPNRLDVEGDFPILHIVTSYPSTTHITEDKSNDTHPLAVLKIDTAAQTLDLGIIMVLGKQLEQGTVESSLENKLILSEEDVEDDMSEMYRYCWREYLKS